MHGEKKTITIFIPAYNEEKNLEEAVNCTFRALGDKFVDFEVIILNAFSTDGTGRIADRIASENKKIKVIHKKQWSGLGTNYMQAVSQSRMEYFVMFPGDNENSWESLSDTFDKIGTADIIIPYTINTEVRSLHRRIISRSFVIFLNVLFGLKLKYYNGNAIYRTDDLKKLTVRSKDFAYNAEILIKLIRSGHSYVETGINIKPTLNTAIFSILNIIGVIKTIFLLFYDVLLINRKKYAYRGKP